MVRSVRYAVLNLGVLLMSLGLVLVVGAAIEGMMTLPAACGAFLVLAAAVRGTWHEICRMERLARAARMNRRMPRRAHAQEQAVSLRVA